MALALAEGPVVADTPPAKLLAEHTSSECDAARSIDELLVVAHREHQSAREAARKTVAHAIRAGEALIAIRDQVPDGEWVRWLEQNFEGSGATAYLYIRFAQHRDALIEEGIVTIGAARDFTRKLVAEQEAEERKRAATQRAEARTLAEQGQTNAQIADTLGVPRSRVKAWFRVTPHHRERRRAERLPPLAPLDEMQHLAALVGEALDTARRLETFHGLGTSIRGLTAVLGAVEKRIDQAKRRAEPPGRLGNPCTCAQAVVDDDGFCAKCGKQTTEFQLEGAAA